MQIKNQFRQIGLAQIPLIIGLVIMILAIPVATKLSQMNQDTRNRAADPVVSCRLTVNANYCGGEGSYCEANSLYTHCQTLAGGIEIGQKICPSGYHCCDPSAVAPTSTPGQKPTCQTICGANYYSCGTPKVLADHRCTLVSTHYDGDTSDCPDNCRCSVCYPLPTDPPDRSPTSAILPSTTWPTCQGLLLNWQKTVENDPGVVSPGSSIKVNFNSQKSSYAKGAIRPKGSSVSQNTHFDIQNGGTFTAPSTAGIYYVALNIYDSEQCNVFCSGGGIWYTTTSTQPDHCLTSGIWTDKKSGCMGCQGWIKVE